nr:40S ribosomal protein S27-2 [Ipomoea batatas]
MQVLPNDVDLLNPPAELEKKKHKLKRLVQSPNSFFMNHCVQPLSDCCGVRELPDGIVPAYWWTC